MLLTILASTFTTVAVADDKHKPIELPLVETRPPVTNATVATAALWHPCEVFDP